MALSQLNAAVPSPRGTSEGPEHDQLDPAARREAPADIDKEVDRRKLGAMSVNIDTLTSEQVQYLSSWQEGT